MNRYREPMAHRPESRARLLVESVAFGLTVLLIVLILGLEGVRS